jgi:hypothetical protein
LTITAITNTKVYDATTLALAKPTVVGLIQGDLISSVSESYNSPNVMGLNGSTLTVNMGYVIADGNGGGNYAVTTITAKGTITPAALTIAATSDTKNFDNTTSSSAIPVVSGLYGADTVTNLGQRFTSSNRMGTDGSTLQVNPGYVVNDGNGGKNYGVTTKTASGTIL